MAKEAEEENLRRIPRAERIIPKKIAAVKRLPKTIKQGYIYKRSRYLKQWKLRYVKIFDNGFIYTYHNEDSSDRPKDTYNLNAFFKCVRRATKLDCGRLNVFILTVEKDGSDSQYFFQVDPSSHK